MKEHEQLSCEQALRLLAEFLDGALGEAAHAGVEHHLETCRSCYSRAEFELRLKAELRALGREDVSPAFERNIRHLITTFTRPAVPTSGDV